MKTFTLAAALAGAALLASCGAGPAGPGDEPLGISSEALKVGDVLDRNGFVDGDGDGIADVLGSVELSGKSMDVRFGVDADHNQRIHVALQNCGPVPAPCGFGANGDARARLVDVTRRANPGEYYKGWLLGRTSGSNNTGNGLCEDDGADAPGREQFRTQLKIWFLTTDGPDPGLDGDVTASCYCNVCPREGGGQTLGKCNTSQWSIAGARLSDDGACKAPPDAKQVRFAILGLARDRQSDPSGSLTGPEAYGTAVFARYVFARCGNDGFCDSQSILDATRWY